jgi:hypothetical protein
MHREAKRAGRASRTALGILLAFAASLAPALSASATPVTLFFNGPKADGTRYGVSESDALLAESQFGVPIVTVEFLVDVTGMLAIQQDLDVSSVSPTPPTSGSMNRATSSWSARNVSGIDLMGASYVAFVTADAYRGIEYQDKNVGLSVDADDGWFLIRATAGAQSYFYPAKLLGDPAAPLLGELRNGDTAEAFDVAVKEPLRQAPMFVLPQLRIGLGFTPIPEPGTALLVGGGLAGLAISRRRRA